MRKLNRKRLIKNMVSLTILSLLGLMAFIPLYWMVVTALKSPTLVLKFPPEILPKSVTLTNFKYLFHRPYILRWTINSFVVAGSVTVARIVLCAMAGYALAKKKFPGAKIFFWLYIGSMMIPSQVTLIPLYVIVSSLRMINTYWGLILPSVAAPFGVFLMRQFMLTLPDEIIEAGRIDGASEFQTFWKIIFPISKPAIAVLGIFTFVNEWNAFLWPLIVTNTTAMKTLQAGLVMIREEVPLEFALHMASSTYAAIPMLIVFFAFQRYFLEGITVGAIK